MKKIVVSAPGKLMLFGEHAVVYDHPCIVTAIDQRMKLTAQTADNFLLNAPDVGISNYSKRLEDLGYDMPKEVRFVEMAFKNLRQKYTQVGGVIITTSSDFTSQFGFGSSSASTVCTVKAVSELYNLNLSKKELFDISYKTVLDIQGKGSGFDIASAIWGGTIYFWTGGKKIEELKIKNLQLIIGYSGIKADTVTLINKVKSFESKNPKKVDKIYKKIETIVEEAKVQILNENWEKVGQLMNKNQTLLLELGVSIDKLDVVIKAAIDSGAHGAKLSGAGGGDCMIAVASQDKRRAIEIEIEKAGGKIIRIDSNAEGVKIE
jgi:mevalonate kinase